MEVIPECLVSHRQNAFYLKAIMVWVQKAVVVEVIPLANIYLQFPYSIAITISIPFHAYADRSTSLTPGIARIERRYHEVEMKWKWDVI